MKKIIILFLIFPAIFGVSCQKEVRYDSELIVEQEKLVVYNENMAQIVFMTAPSDLTVALENLTLVSTRTSVTTSSPDDASPDAQPSDNLYRLAGVEPFVTESGQTEPGKWIATIELTERRSFIGITNLYLVLRVNEKGYGVAKSREIEVINVPALSDESITVDFPTALTYKIVPDPSSSIAPHVNAVYAFIPFTDMMIEARSMGVEWIREMTARILPGEYADFVTVDVPRAEDREYFGLFITPVDARFSTLTDDDFPVSVDVEFTVTDLDGKPFTKTSTIRFYNYMVTIPASETGLEFYTDDPDTYHVGMEQALSRVGITAAFFAQNPRLTNPSLAFRTVEESGADAIDIFLEEYTGPESAYRNITDPENFHVSVTNWLPADYPGTYYGVLGIVLMDYLTFRPVIVTRIRLEMIAVEKD